MKVSRRQFLRSASAAGTAFALGPSRGSSARPLDRAGFGFPDPPRHWHGDSSVAAALRAYGRVSASGGPSIQRQKPTRAPGDGATPREPPTSLVDRFPDLPRHFVFERVDERNEIGVKVRRDRRVEKAIRAAAIAA